MQYQLQFYDVQDYEDPEKRTVVATTSGSFTEDQINEWGAKVVKDNPIPEGKTCMLVADNSPWFIPTVEENPDKTIAINTPISVGKSEGEARILTFEECQLLNRKIDEQNRLEAIARQERLDAYMAAFEG